jgi:hypothetical protein
MDFVAGTAIWAKGVTPTFSFSQPTSFVGAKITAEVAIDNPNAAPIEFKLYAMGGPDWTWVEYAVTDTESLDISGGFKDVEFPLVDKPPFCSALILQYGVQVVPIENVTANNAGHVDLYLQSISVIGPAASTIDAGAGGSSGAAGGTNAAAAAIPTGGSAGAG